jgi:HK97 gp10 family phage protein
MPTEAVSGLADLENALTRLKEDVAKKAMRNATAAGARVIRDLARVRARSLRYATGDLANDIIVTTRVDLANGIFTAKIRARGKPRKGKEKTIAAVRKILWLEFGVKPHFIDARGNKSARNLNKGVALALKLGDGNFVEGVDHPGIAPHPILRPAADEGWQKAVEVFKQQLTDAINKATRK